MILNKPEKAFTLVELSIVIVIVGLIIPTAKPPALLEDSKLFYI